MTDPTDRLTPAQVSDITGLFRVEGRGIPVGDDGLFARADVDAFMARRRRGGPRKPRYKVLAPPESAKHKAERIAAEEAAAAAPKPAPKAGPPATQKQIDLIAKLARRMPAVPGGVMTSIGRVEIPSHMSRRQASDIIDALLQHEM